MARKNSLIKAMLAALGALILGVGLAACSPVTPGSAEVTADTIVIDVRTADEYAGGHLEGAQLLDLSAGQVEAAIPSLDPEAEYFVYCRSGNRSAQAVKLMKQAGFANVTDLGSVNQATNATGLPIVTG